MELDERKVKILKAIIKNYMDTGEPVGSRTISKYLDTKWSSATIRNEMSDLEEMGYIIQPHTSAGRIPSDKGYRFYVDQIMQEKDNEVADMQELMIQRVDRLESVAGQDSGEGYQLCGADQWPAVPSQQVEVHSVIQSGRL